MRRKRSYLLVATRAALVAGALAGALTLVTAPAAAEEGPPRVLLSRTGVLVPPGSEVTAGSSVVIAVSGFPAEVRVSLTLGTWPVPQSFVTSASGSGSVDTVVPATLASSVYVLAASGGNQSAAFVFYVYNPPKVGPTPTPTPTPSSVVVVAPRVVLAGDAGTAASAGSLPVTGVSLLPLLVTAGVSLLGGLVLVLAGRRRPTGRHGSDHLPST